MAGRQRADTRRAPGARSRRAARHQRPVRADRRAVRLAKMREPLQTRVPRSALSEPSSGSPLEPAELPVGVVRLACPPGKSRLVDRGADLGGGLNVVVRDQVRIRCCGFGLIGRTVSTHGSIPSSRPRPYSCCRTVARSSRTNGFLRGRMNRATSGYLSSATPNQAGTQRQKACCP
jgi:hypothetical protein